jgi:hypothetical protein
MKNKFMVLLLVLVALFALYKVARFVLPFVTTHPELADEYPFLNSRASWNTTHKQDMEKLWFGNDKVIGEGDMTLSSRDQDFYCEGVKKEPIVYEGGFHGGRSKWKGRYEVTTEYQTAWARAVSVIDCGSYYWVYRFGAAGPMIDGPFTDKRPSVAE